MHGFILAQHQALAAATPVSPAAEKGAEPEKSAPIAAAVAKSQQPLVAVRAAAETVQHDVENAVIKASNKAADQAVEKECDKTGGRDGIRLDGPGHRPARGKPRLAQA